MTWFPCWFLRSASYTRIPSAIIQQGELASSWRRSICGKMWHINECRTCVSYINNRIQQNSNISAGFELHHNLLYPFWFGTLLPLRHPTWLPPRLTTPKSSVSPWQVDLAHLPVLDLSSLLHPMHIGTGSGIRYRRNSYQLVHLGIVVHFGRNWWEGLFLT